MAGRHIKALIAAYRDRDDLAFRRAAQSIIEEEESKNHVALARDLRRLLASGGTLQAELFDQPLPDPPRDQDSALPLADLAISNKVLADLVLDPVLKTKIDELISEIPLWSSFDAAGVPRRNRILLYGPPGCGKTSIAEAIAGELGRVLVTVRIEGVISSLLGETAANLRRIFDFANEGAYVILFDEFDSLAKDRDDPSDHGELRRIVNAVLQLIDRYRGPSILIAATNHDQVIDSAMWRRFDETLHLGLPDDEGLKQLLRQWLAARGGRYLDLDSAATELLGHPYAAAEAVAQSSLRKAITAGRSTVNSDDLESAILDVKSRRWM